MSNSIARGTRMLRQVGLAVIVLWTIPGSLWSQDAYPSQKGDEAVSQPFAAYNESLTRAADSVLAAATRTSADSNGQSAIDKTPGTGLVVLNGPQMQSWNGGSGAAAARVDLLRPAIEPILRNHGIPTDLVAVVLVESGGRANALSPKGARGLWQLMPDTARRYGLRVDENQDERLDLFKATEAAAQYLHDLHAQFGDWKLALAAYNTGELNLGTAILRAHSQDFDQLTNLRVLPLETRSYVPRVLAAIRSISPASTLAEYHGETSTAAVYASSSR